LAGESTDRRKSAGRGGSGRGKGCRQTRQILLGSDQSNPMRLNSSYEIFRWRMSRSAMRFDFLKVERRRLGPRQKHAETLIRRTRPSLVVDPMLC
jgi:hypothetical protein